MKRRSFLLSGLGVAGALVVGWVVLPAPSRLGHRETLPAVEGEVGLNGWIKIANDGGVLLAMNRSEMGQGVHTALAMLVAEELDIPLERVLPIEAGADRIYGNVAAFEAMLPLHPADREPDTAPPAVRIAERAVAKLAGELGINITGGSTSVADGWDVLRLAGAHARARLLGAAAIEWKLPVTELGIADGVVVHPTGQRAHFGELARAAAGVSVSTFAVKPREQWRLIGRSAARNDLAAKIDGSAIFGIDVRRPDMLHAVVRHSPTLGGGAVNVDVAAALRRPGVERVVRLGPYAGSTSGVAVVARSYWHALQAADAMAVEWRPSPGAPLDSGTIERKLERAARRDKGFEFLWRGDVDAAEARAARTHEALYRAPYLAHAALEPMNCTARVAGGKVEVWASTQVPGMARAMAASVAGVPEDDVTVHVTFLGGGFGRRLEVDAVGQAVRVALETGGRPVQLVWPREEDMTHDFYRPAAVALMTAGLDARGQPASLRIRSAGDAVVARWMERTMPALAAPFDLPDKTTSEGLYDLPYAFDHQRVTHVATRSGVPVGYWRSVGHSHNAFFSECFVDELAHEASADPVAFRLGLLKDRPRHAAVLRLAAEKAGWRTSPAPSAHGSRALGVALHESFGSVVAQVVEASLPTAVGETLPRVHRVVCAIDCGTVVNPGLVAQQMESGVVFALSAALHGRIDIAQGAVRQRNFPDYPLVTMAQAPRVETYIVPSERPPVGVGEPGVPPLAPALANALFVLTGNRQRSLPLRV
jgi:isoquinoline 1-oxidoreductase beta subunit